MPSTTTSSAATSVTDWFASHLPTGLYAETPQITVDREEILVVGALPAPEEQDAHGPEEAVARHRRDTREQRVLVARDAEALFNRTVSWGVTWQDTTYLYTHLAAPVMTRLRQPERQLLDLLVEAGVARSRSEALSWCVALVGEREDEWLTELEGALATVREARALGPAARREA